MSTREGQHGRITFTKSGYGTMMRNMRKMFNEYQDEGLKFAREVHAFLAAIDGRGAMQKRQTAMQEASWNNLPWSSNRPLIQTLSITDGKRTLNIPAEFQWGIERALFGRSKTGAMLKPRRQDFPRLTNKQTEFAMHVDDFGITLSETDRGGVLIWDIDYGSNNVRHAEATKLHKDAMHLLRRHQWKRGEGGVFYSDDEHAKDAAREHGEAYGSSVTATFGPLGKQAQ